jgi:hypothetical protein
MAQLRSETLDADDETFTLDVAANERAFITMTVTSAITTTWTVAAPGSTRFIALRKSDDSTAAAYTASDYLMVDGPVTLKATASGVSGGNCIIDVRKGILDR